MDYFFVVGSVVVDWDICVLVFVVINVNVMMLSWISHMRV